MLSIKKHIPNFITCLNLLCGCVGIVLCFQGYELTYATYLIWLGAFFDFMDGMVARLTKTYSEIGKQLDSLADMITFSLLPSVIMFALLSKTTDNPYLPYLAFSIAVFSALRLAKFNIDTRQTTSFIGLPTPANALFISSIPLVLAGETVALQEFLLNPYILVAITIVFSGLLVAEIELLALKFKDTSWANNKIKYILLIVSVILIAFIKFEAIPLIILFYIILSVLDKYLLK
jgi:CDP-diacylglycerol---serine O-phosphatidyltransferase